MKAIKEIYNGYMESIEYIEQLDEKWEDQDLIVRTETLRHIIATLAISYAFALLYIIFSLAIAFYFIYKGGLI